MKQYVIFVNSLYNVIQAIQMRRTLFAEEQMDIVLSDEVKGLDEIYERGHLLECFEHVYYAKTACVTKQDRLMALLQPGHLYKKMLGIKKLPNYTDVLMWNPDLIFYSYYMDRKKHKKQFNLHVYGDANNGWYKEQPDGGEITFYWYYRGFLNRFMERHYDFKQVAKMEYDFYMLMPEWRLYEGKRKVIAIPPIDPKDKEMVEYLNKVFAYDQDFVIQEPVIYLGIVPGEADSVESVKKLLLGARDVVGEQNIIAKRHPRDTQTFYDEEGINYVKTRFAWELYCLNHSIDDKVIITYGTTGIMIPCAAFHAKPKTYIYPGDFWLSDQGRNDSLERFVEMMKQTGVPVEMYTSIDDLLSDLRKEDIH